MGTTPHLSCFRCGGPIADDEKFWDVTVLEPGLQDPVEAPTKSLVLVCKQCAPATGPLAPGQPVESDAPSGATEVPGTPNFLGSLPPEPPSNSE